VTQSSNELASLLTVLMAVRNEAAEVAAFAANLGETLDGAQLVIVDDASEDGTAALVAQALPSAVVVPGAGRGLARALNDGLAHVRTPLVARADADDLSLPGRFRRQAMALEEHPSWVACATWAVERGPGAAERVVAPPADGDEMRRTLLRTNPITHGSAMIRTQAIRAVGGYDPRFVLAQDYDLWLRLSQLGDIGVVEEVLYIRQPPAGADFRIKRRGQSAFSARAQVRHWRQTRRVNAPALVRNVAGAIWPGRRPTEGPFFRKRLRTHVEAPMDS
jgi:glycosyltransferase involved in cell wall biosynthesis